MKAVLSNNLGGNKTKHSISIVNNYFKDNLLMIEAKKLHDKSTNGHNIAMIIRRLHKDWKNYFTLLKNYNNGNTLGLTGKPNHPQSKSLSKTYSYSVPLEKSKHSIKQLKDGLLGINISKKMFYTYIGKNIEYINNKKINNITVHYSHGHIHYNCTYEVVKKDNNNDKVKVVKEAGGDVGINNLLSLFINDSTSKSLIISGNEIKGKNYSFNKKLSNLNESIENEVKSYKKVKGKDGKEYEVPESYTKLGKVLIYKKSQLYERYRLYLNDYLHKISKKVLTYLKLNEVTVLVLSKNLSFTKTTGEIKMIKKNKQKYYQIPFGRLLTMIESKSENYGIEVKYIDEAYTSKTSSISSDVNEVQEKGKVLRNKKLNKEVINDYDKIKPNDLNGNRGYTLSNNKNNPNNKNKLGRGMYKDSKLNKIINADINGACNHIKIYLKNKSLEMIEKIKTNKKYLMKWSNPLKIKSNHEFDKLLKNLLNNEYTEYVGKVFNVEQKSRFSLNKVD